MKLQTFNYDLNRGPLEFEALQNPLTRGNCRLAIQYYFFKKHNYFLSPEDAICPRLYHAVGEKISLDKKHNLKTGDVILAHRVKNKNGKPIDRSPDYFKNEQDWIIALHSAIFLGQNLKKPIWHATSIDGKTSYWTIEKFLYYYRPILAKRIISQNTKNTG
jgi:hypothetical protein